MNNGCDGMQGSGSAHGEYVGEFPGLAQSVMQPSHVSRLSTRGKNEV